MNASIGAMITVFNPSVESIDTGVVGAIVIGILVTYLNNRYRGIQLPSFLGFFGGSRFIPIVSSFSAIFVGGIFFLIWPTFQGWLVAAGTAIAGMGYFGTYLYGFLLRLTGAVGLHHMIYPMFWFTELGGVATVAGQQVVGAQKIFLQNWLIRIMLECSPKEPVFAGRFATMMFGLPAACLAMYHCVPKNRRKLVFGLFFSAALTSFLTGITEPIEFMFLFVAPWLYVIHAALDGLSFMIADMLSVRIGNTFSGGAIDFLLFGVLQGNARTNWIYVIIIGLFWAIIYYLVFRFLITKFNVATPGRESDGESVSVESKDSIGDTAMKVLSALGGKENLEDVDACITRLRVAVKDVSKVDKDTIKELGATAVLEVKGGIQAVFGAKADLIKQKINETIGEE